MKKSNSLKLLLAAVIPGVTAFGVIPITENFSIRGYFDGTYTNRDDEGTATDMEGLDLGNADIDLLISTDKVKSEIHIGSDGTTPEIEQAFITFDLGGGLSITGGKFLTSLSFEGDEQYMLYQQSRAYDFGIMRAGANNNFRELGTHNQHGARATYKMDNLSASVSVIDQAFSTNGAAGDASDVGFEAAITYNAMKGLTIAVGTGQDGGDTSAGMDKLYNIWAQYDGIENLILAAEYNFYENYGQDADSWLIMGNYSFGNSLAATLRYSQAEEDLNMDDGSFEASKFTISPSYSFTDNLLGVIEYSTGEYNVRGEGDIDVDFIALQGLFTF
jgi:hypothetical protein